MACTKYSFKFLFFPIDNTPYWQSPWSLAHFSWLLWGTVAILLIWVEDTTLFSLGQDTICWASVFCWFSIESGWDFYCFGIGYYAHKFGIGQHAVQFGNNWMKKILRTAKLLDKATDSIYFSVFRFFT